MHVPASTESNLHSSAYILDRIGLLNLHQIKQLAALVAEAFEHRIHFVRHIAVVDIHLVAVAVDTHPSVEEVAVDSGTVVAAAFFHQDSFERKNLLVDLVSPYFQELVDLEQQQLLVVEAFHVEPVAQKDAFAVDVHIPLELVPFVAFLSVDQLVDSLVAAFLSVDQLADS